MKQAIGSISFETSGQGFVDVTPAVERWIADQTIGDGLLTLFIRHTSASLLVQENADPDVLHDLQCFFKKLVPEGVELYRHSLEGPDDMPAHIRCALTQTQLAVPLRNGRLHLGTWQAIYLFEHRAAPHSRTVDLHLLGE
ncbi:MAG: secondary thiamine-phosphate synthase enzyme YjbQ [Sphingomonadales bacterium]